MSSLKSLRDDGWRIDEIKLREAMGDTFDEKMGKEELKKFISNLDIKEFSEAFLSESISNKSLKGPVIVQLSKWENVSYPKINEHFQNNGVCLLILTDGAKPTKAMTTEPLANISGETPYGAKILLTGDLKLENGILQLTPKNCKFIGGTVEKMVEKWKTERFSSSKDARNASDAPKWTSIGVKSNASVRKEKDNFKSMATTEEAKPSENNEFEIARQQEIANLAELRKNTHIASVKLPENAKKSNTVSENGDEAVSKHEATVKQGQQYDNTKQDKYRTKQELPNSGNNSGSRPNFGKGRNRDNYEDIRTYTTRPSSNATLFDHILTQIPDPPPDFSVKHDNAPDSYRNNSGRNDNRGGYKSVQQNNYSNVSRNEFAQMDISGAHRGAPHNSGNNYRGRGNRSRGGRGKPFNSYGNNTYQNFPPHRPSFPSFVPNVAMPPPLSDFPLLGQQPIRNSNPVSTNVGQPFQAPLPDNNVRKTFYNTSRKR